MNLATTVSIKYVPEENGKKIRKHNGNHRGFFILFCFKKKTKQLVISTGTGHLLISRKSIELLPNNRQSTPPADRI